MPAPTPPVDPTELAGIPNREQVLVLEWWWEEEIATMSYVDGEILTIPIGIRTGRIDLRSGPSA